MLCIYRDYGDDVGNYQGSVQDFRAYVYIN